MMENCSRDEPRITTWKYGKETGILSHYFFTSSDLKIYIKGEEDKGIQKVDSIIFYNSKTC
jgi:hypothetical protein